ncbi:MAG TPA: Gfo/Idh/MocA family oxidoreductase [Oscillospiraceae bacterium]|nr:Gfo/Idh/MocA family oxidoreductase [Oscillospiraceae bacterium]HPF55436.1 Gfo/Idh/MocA family oxidoreductase [Clostridiales bacterium]HPK36249.1 Gfo/Idh/MocA family oxidoreductase [Oscillospiraceae bacterium]HPR75483.1 Gfo/Idh/MocA family oxidoreductase [Oscillospiraceae bacterium]
MEKKIKLCVTGYGNIGTLHCKRITDGVTRGVELVAICDNNPAKIEAARKLYGESVKYFDSAEQAIASGVCDSMLVATPHYAHPEITIKALEGGLNVLCEKPIGVYTSAVRKMNEAAQKSGKVFGIMYNQRTNPLYQKLRKMIMDGELGEIRRVIWIITNWYRSQSYYDSGGWRATWAGEGGGVLLNQDPHQLDLWQWLCGMPKRIHAHAYNGRHRNIEVENDVTAFAEYENGATGLFVTSTFETPGTNRLEISADNGKVVLENDKLIFTKNKVSETEWNQTCKTGFGEPEHEVIEITAPEVEECHLGHAGILTDFASAILNGTPLLAPGIEGIRGLSISNSIHLSAWTGEWVEPEHIDEKRFEMLLAEKINDSTVTKDSSGVTLNAEGTF